MRELRSGTIGWLRLEAMKRLIQVHVNTLIIHFVLRNLLAGHCFVLVVCTIELTHAHSLFANSEGG